MAQEWASGIACVRTWKGWLYLAVVIELYPRRDVGWSTKPGLAREIVLDAALMAARRRNQTRIHSDQGSQYGSDAWRRFRRVSSFTGNIHSGITFWIAFALRAGR